MNTDRDRPRPVVLDTTVVSNFASSDSIGWLVDLVSRPVVVPAVRSELQRGVEHGHQYLTSAVDGFEAAIELAGIESEPESADTTAVRQRLDAGEAESLLYALAADGTIATDDLAARRLADEYGVPVTGSVGLLVTGIRRDRLEATTANEWLETWQRERGYFAPVDRIEDALDS